MMSNPILFTDQAAAVKTLFKLQERIEDLDETFPYCEEATKISPVGDSGLSFRLHDFGGALELPFDHFRPSLRSRGRD